MRAGHLDRIITVQRPGSPSATDAYGQPLDSWTTHATLRAQLVQASTEEFLRSHGPQTVETTIFRTRYLPDLRMTDRVVYDGRRHEIIELKEIGRRRGWEIRTVLRGPDARP